MALATRVSRKERKKKEKSCCQSTRVRLFFLRSGRLLCATRADDGRSAPFPPTDLGQSRTSGSKRTEHVAKGKDRGSADKSTGRTQSPRAHSIKKVGACVFFSLSVDNARATRGQSAKTITIKERHIKKETRARGRRSVGVCSSLAGKRQQENTGAHKKGLARDYGGKDVDSMGKKRER